MERLFNFAWMFALLLGLLAANPPAHADGIVLSVQGGATFAGDTGLDGNGLYDRDTSLGTGFNVGGSGGYEMALGGGRARALIGVDYMGGLSAEMGASQTAYGLTASVGEQYDVSNVSGVLGFEYDFTQYKLGPAFLTIGAGLQAGQNMVDGKAKASLSGYGHSLDLTCKGDSSNFAWGWHGKAGIGFDVTENLSGEVAYRYIDRGNAETPDNYDCNLAFDGSSIGTGKINVNSEDIDTKSHEVLFNVKWRI